MNATLYCGDVREVLASLPDGSVQMVCTSPPFWGLRDYGTGRWEGGEVECDHGAARVERRQSGRQTNVEGGTPGSLRDKPVTVCKCGATRIDQQLGLERTPEEYVANMVAVFRDVRRVLRDDGVLWLNLGDCYATGAGRVGGAPGGGEQGERWRGGHDGKHGQVGPMTQPNRMPIPGHKPKDLVGIPWLVAFALRADGWYLRSEIIWAKPNPMPESVTDRPTKAHEQVFLLSKSERYFYDAAAIAEPVAPSQVGRVRADAVGGASHAERGQHSAGGVYRSGNKARIIADEASERCRLNTHMGSGIPWEDNGLGRNARTVWTIATQPYPGAHFATFPPELARRCILAGSRAGDLVLDPFGGSGTVAAVAVGHGRGATYIDLNPAYLELARQRIGPMLCR